MINHFIIQKLNRFLKSHYQHAPIIRYLPTYLLCIIVVLTSTACQGPATFVVGLNPGTQKLKTQTVYESPKKTSKQVAIIDITGIITNTAQGGFLSQGENPVAFLQEQLDHAAKDSKTVAIILRINSPGGGVTASEAMYQSVLRFKQQTQKPVIAMCMDVAASGGYYVACSADMIIAYPSTTTGSIGVILQTVQFEKALNRLGIQTDAIVSGPNKAAGSPLATMTPKQRQTLQTMVDTFYEAFVNVVETNRPNINQDQLATVTDGRVFSGQDALAYGLIDQLGDIYNAIDLATKQTNHSYLNAVIYKRPLAHSVNAYGPAKASHNSLHASASTYPQTTVVNGLNLQLNTGLTTSGPIGHAPGFYYLWLGQ